MTVTARTYTRGPAVDVIYRQSNALGTYVIQGSPPATRTDIPYLYQDISQGQAHGVIGLQDLANGTGTGSIYSGAELTMGPRLVDVHGRDTALAKFARGSTGPVQWDPADPTKNTSLMVAFVRRYLDALRNVSVAGATVHRDPYLSSFLFVGGEEEALTDGHSSTMQSIIEALSVRLRGEFGPGVRHIMCDVQPTITGRTTPRVTAVRAGLAAAVAADDLAGLVDVSDLTRTDGVHYDRAGYDAIGTRAANLLETLEEYDPAGDAGAVRASLYDSLARATSARRYLRSIGEATSSTPIRVGPVDALWAVPDPFSVHHVSSSAWSAV